MRTTERYKDKHNLSEKEKFQGCLAKYKIIKASLQDLQGTLKTLTSYLSAAF